MEKQIDLYPGRNTWYDRKEHLIKEHKKLSRRNKQLLLDWGLYNQTNGKPAGKYTVSKRWGQLIPIALWLGKDFDKVVVEDLQKLMLRFRDHPKWSEETKADYRRSVKQFYKWLDELDPRHKNEDAMIRDEAKRFYSYIYNKVNTKPSHRKKIDPKEVLGPEDLRKLMTEGCETSQERALIALMHETGARASEIFSVRIKHFTAEKRGLGNIYFPKSKTEERLVHILDSVPYLIEHIKQHPLKEDQDAPLFVYEKRLKRKKIRYEAFTHPRALHLVRRIFKRAELKKPSNPHWFRHSRASLDSTSSHMSPEVRCHRMGWAPGSKQIRTYSHLSNEDIRAAWLRERNIEDSKYKKEEPQECPNCKAVVGINFKLCPFCLRPLNKEELEKERCQQEKLAEQGEQLMDLIPTIDDGEMQKEFINTIKELNTVIKEPKRLRALIELLDQTG